MRIRFRIACKSTCWFAAAISACVSVSETRSDEPPRGLESRLLAQRPADLIQQSIDRGDARRGAIVFHQPQMACARCHTETRPNGDRQTRLGPDLAVWEQPPSDAHLVESILDPSRQIRKGYQAYALVTRDGETITGLLVDDADEAVTLRDPSTGALIRLSRDEIDVGKPVNTSIMPAGQVNQLSSRQQFLDLVRYLMEIRDGGPSRARELQPPPSLFVLRIPEYESHVDHAGLIRDLDRDAFNRGEAIYNRLCINCHGDHDRPGSLPTALRFASGRFKNGSDPHAMYQTLTRGFGFMAPQTWMVPQQKYDVIHYIREAYLRDHNPQQFVRISDAYLAGLPPGDTRGPEPVDFRPWIDMDYGPSLINTYEVGSDRSNFAQKGIAVRLDPGPGGVSRGAAWMIFDHDTMRIAAAWTADNAPTDERFIDWNGIHFNGRHQIHPRVVGRLRFSNPTGPGWADPRSGSFADDRRVKGRDGRMYGPLPPDWAKLNGIHAHGEHTLISYRIGKTDVLEMPGLIASPQADSPVFTRSFNVQARNEPLTLLVATHPDDACRLSLDGPLARLAAAPIDPVQEQVFQFDGATHLEVSGSDDFDMTTSDFSITARIRTKRGGTIFCKTRPAKEWTPDGKTLFIRDGRLCYDIGWVGVVTSERRVNDGEWHDVALTWNHKSARATLYIDGERQARKALRPRNPAAGEVVRIGYTASDFPQPDSFFSGEIESVRFDQRELTPRELLQLSRDDDSAIDDDSLIARWQTIAGPVEGRITDTSENKHDAVIVKQGTTATTPTDLIAGLSQEIPGAVWQLRGRQLCLTMPVGEDPLRFVLWIANRAPAQSAADASPGATDDLPPLFADPSPDLTALTRGGPRRWAQPLTTRAVLGNDTGPFAVDVLTRPETNPWLAQTRLTGLDFFADSDQMAVCSWDGDVWVVSGLNRLDDAPATDEEPQPPELTWRRITSGLFQPLGLRIVDDVIYVSCRDQIVILRDLNGDGEIDYHECFNNDHQVTEHFHEFAMGLQTDDKRNFYYAKSARHALPAVVPHHGTLLRVSPDGSHTDILATGFRAANGVCLNPDGSFVVTDQEGHWNPKNRINWVHEGGFYGNMFGYHNVTDSSDAAMQQPLCWITNSFDRSPAELLWVTSPKWGPLEGALLNLSYGYGKVYIVPHETVDGQPQGGMCEFPIPQLPTGVMRGRFHPVDGQLYLCGMFAWAGNQQQPGGLYRLRSTGRPAYLPVGLSAHARQLKITFSEPLSTETAADPGRFAIRVWDLKRTANYGSDHFNERSLTVKSAELSNNDRTLSLAIENLEPTWCMEIRCRLQTPDGEDIERVIHNTVHNLRQP